MNVDDLPADALVLVDTGPVIYVLDGHREFGPKFRPLFEAHDAGRLRLAVTPITIMETLGGPARDNDRIRAAKYYAVLTGWIVVPTDASIAASAARIRAEYKLKSLDAIQIASAFHIDADAFVTHDRDFERIRRAPAPGNMLRIIS